MAQGVVNAASNMNPQLGPMTMGGLIGNNPGDLLANGFQKALNVLDTLMSRFRSINGSNLGINSTVHSENISDDSDGYHFGNGFGTGGFTTDNSSSNSQSTITFAPGSIQINSTGNANYDAETLVAKIEEYLINRNNASLS
jgi:hypothetical protein